MLQIYLELILQASKPPGFDFSVSGLQVMELVHLVNGMQGDIDLLRKAFNDLDEHARASHRQVRLLEHHIAMRSPDRCQSYMKAFTSVNSLWHATGHTLRSLTKVTSQIRRASDSNLPRITNGAPPCLNIDPVSPPFVPISFYFLFKCWRFFQLVLFSVFDANSNSLSTFAMDGDDDLRTLADGLRYYKKIRRTILTQDQFQLVASNLLGEKKIDLTWIDSQLTDELSSRISAARNYQEKKGKRPLGMNFSGLYPFVDFTILKDDSYRRVTTYRWNVPVSNQNAAVRCATLIHTSLSRPCPLPLMLFQGL